MRSRRVETCSFTRWSSRITQSDTYSSSPWRVSCPSPRSPVITTDTPRSLRKRNSRRSSARRIASLLKLENSDSMVSSTTRFAPTDWMAKSRRRNSPSRSYSPLSSISLRSISTVSMAISPRSTRSLRSKPSEATFFARSSDGSSKLMNTPGSPKRVAPLTRNCMANSVLPHPGPPHTRVGRPAGRPPPVISSKPRIPVGAFSMPLTGAEDEEED